MPPGPFGYSVDGVFGGGTAGYNLQFDNFVFGIEGDLGFIDPNGRGIIPSSNPIYHQDITLDSGLYGDITGRLGVTFDGLLIYAKGGFTFFDGEAKQATTKPGYAPTGTDTFTGGPSAVAPSTSSPGASASRPNICTSISAPSGRIRRPRWRIRRPRSDTSSTTGMT